MIAALDWGGSWADAVLWDGRLEGTFSVPSRQTTAEDLLGGVVRNNGVPLEKIRLVAATGGDSRKVGPSVLGKPSKFFSELECIALGASNLSGLSEAVAVSCGTGTAVVYYTLEGGLQALHLGGTGVGGGTLEGLAKMLLDVEVEKLEGLAAKTKETLDLTVADIVGGGIGVVPGDATASNFGKVNGDFSREKAARSLLYLAAETVATVASLASEKVGCNDLVFTGRVASNKLFQERLSITAKIYGKKAFYLEKGEYATAIGAALKASGI